MKLIDLFEEDDDDFDYDYIVDKIENECGDMLEAYRAARKVLYRGTKNGPTVFSKADIRQDRKPVEMSEKSHILINSAMTKLNLPTRGNSLFVSADRTIARSWGPLHVIFIPDGWKGLVYDGVRSSDYSYDKLAMAAATIKMNQKPDDEKLEAMIDAIEKLNPRTFNNADDLEAVLRKETADILMHGKSYYKLSLDLKFSKHANEIANRLRLRF